MSNVSSPLQIALQLIVRFDVDLRAIILLSLQVSLTASVCAFVIGAPLGTALAVYRFPGRDVLVVIANTLLGLPPVVVGATGLVGNVCGSRVAVSSGALGCRSLPAGIRVGRGIHRVVHSHSDAYVQTWKFRQYCSVDG